MEKYGNYSFVYKEIWGIRILENVESKKACQELGFLKLSNASDVNREKIVVNHEIVNCKPSNVKLF